MIKIPTTAELYTSILSDIEATFEGSIPTFGKNFLRVLAAVQAAKLRLQYLLIARVQKNIFIDTADAESFGGTLERFGRVKLGRNPFPAKAAQYNAQVTGTVGAIIPASATFKSNDDSLNPGKLYITDIARTLTAPTGFIFLRALEAGLDGSLLIDDQLTATSPIAGVDRLAIINSIHVQPLSAEDLELYRDRALESYRLEAQGGAAADYRLWGFDEQGVKQIYAYAKSNAPNEVNIFVEATIADSTDGKGTPSVALLAAVKEVINFDPDTTKPLAERGRIPLGVFEDHVLPIEIKEVEISIADFEGITPEIEALLFAALKIEIDLVRPFVGGADVLEFKNDILDLNKVISTVLSARPGSIFGAITLQVDGNVTNSYTFSNGDIPSLDTVTYI